LAWNLFGARAVGDGSIGLAVLLLLPFMLLVAAAIILGPKTSAPFAKPNSVDWFSGVLIAMWNYMGWDNASPVAQEVRDPQRTYPKVMLSTLLLITTVYTLPVLAARWAGIPSAAWTTGSWVSIAEMVGGRWLGIFVLIGTIISVVGMLNSLMMSYSRLPVALAEDGYAPRVLIKQLPNGAPWVAVLTCAAGWMLALGLSFDRILLMDILLYGLSLILEFVALVALRMREPDLARPFRVPGGIAGAAALGVGPTALLGAAFVANRHEQIGGVHALTVAGAVLVVGVVVYILTEHMTRRLRRPTNSK
jgi:amino acid transporter